MAHVYFTDRDLGKQFPCRLREAGLGGSKRGRRRLRERRDSASAAVVLQDYLDGRLRGLKP